jgi:predicted ATPase
VAPGLSEVQPLAVLFEDLHWCDASTLELLGRLIAQSPTAHLLVLATARPEFTPPWPTREHTTTLHLGRLTKRQAREMIAALAGEDLPSGTLDALLARADGVPLYLEELTKAVVEPGVTGSIEAIPATLADSLTARLDRLSSAKEVARRAAVLGREFPYALLVATAGMETAALEHGLARLVEAELLFVRGVAPAATYTFKHALVQEAAYESLLKRTRQQLHGRVVDVLLGEFAERAATRGAIDAGLALSADTGQRFMDAELHRLRGEIARAERDASAAAEACFRRGLEIARAQEATSLELRAATSLSRLWREQGRGAMARDLLGPLRARFTEGCDTGDLIEATALLAQL